MDLEPLSQRITADSTEFRRELDRAQESLRSTGVEAERVAQRVDRAMSGIGRSGTNLGGGWFAKAREDLSEYGRAAQRTAETVTDAFDQVEAGLAGAGSSAGAGLGAAAAATATAGAQIETELLDTVGTVEDAEARFAAAQRRWEQSAGAWGTATPELGRQVESFARVGPAAEEAANVTARSSRRMSFALQNVGFQVQDFVVQVTNGTNAFRAFAQQAPQALAFIPGIGLMATLGVSAVATLLSLGSALVANSQRAKEAGQDFDALGKELDSLAQSYRVAGDAAREFIAGQAQSAVRGQGRELTEQRQELEQRQQELARRTSQTARVSVAGGDLTLDQARALRELAESYDPATDSAAAFREEVQSFANQAGRNTREVLRAIIAEMDETGSALEDVRQQFELLSIAAQQPIPISIQGLEKLQQETTGTRSPENLQQIQERGQAFPAGTEARARFDDYIKALDDLGIELGDATSLSAELQEMLARRVDAGSIERYGERLDEVGDQLRELASEEAQLRAQIAGGGRLTAGVRTEIEVARIAADPAQGPEAAEAQRPAIARNEALRDVIAGQQFTAALSDQAEQLRLQLQFVGEQSLEYRTQIALLTARQQLMRQLTESETANVAAIEAGRVALEQGAEIQSAREGTVVARQPTAELQDMARAMAQVTDISRVQGPEQLRQIFDELDEATQRWVGHLTDAQAAARDIEIGRDLDQQIAQQQQLLDFGGQETEEYRVQAQLLQLKLQYQLDNVDAYEDEVRQLQRITQALEEQAAVRQLESEGRRVQGQTDAATNPLDILSGTFLGVDSESTRIEQRRAQERENLNLAPDAILPEDVEASIVALEQYNSQLAITETAMGTVSDAAADLAMTLAFEGADAAGEQLLQMLVKLQFQLAADLLVATLLKAVMAGIGGGAGAAAGAPLFSQGQLGFGGTAAGGGSAAAPLAGGIPQFARGGRIRSGQVAEVGEGGDAELYVPDGLAATRGSVAEVVKQAAEMGVPLAAATRMAESRGGQALLGMLAEASDGSTEAPGKAAASFAPRGVQVLGRMGAETFVPSEDGTVIPAEDLRALEAAPAGQAMLRRFGRRSGGSVTAGRRYVAGEGGGLELFVPRGLQRGGVARKGEAVTVGEAGEELAAPGRLGRLIRANQLDDAAPLLDNLPPWERPMMVGRAGREEFTPPVDSEIIAHHDLARLQASTAGAEIVRLAMEAPRSPDTTRMLASGTVAVGAAASSPQGSGGGGRSGTQVTVIDQRPHGSPPIAVQNTEGPDGREMLTLLVRGGINEMRKSGELAEMMRSDFNLSTRPR